MTSSGFWFPLIYGATTCLHNSTAKGGNVMHQ